MQNDSVSLAAYLDEEQNNIRLYELKDDADSKLPNFSLYEIYHIICKYLKVCHKKMHNETQLISIRSDLVQAISMFLN